MGIRDKESINADRRDTHLQDEYVSKERAPLSEREVLEKRLFKHSEFKKPYDADDYAQMERNFTFPKSLFPTYTPPSPPDVPPGADKPEDADPDAGGVPDDEPDLRSAECECNSGGLTMQFIGIVPDGTPFEGSNDCGATFDETGFTSEPAACLPEHWLIKIPPCYGECEAFLVMLFNGFGYPRRINWSHSGAGGEFTIRKLPGEFCFEEGSWRVPLKDLFSEIDCSGENAPRIVLNVETVSENMDGTSCTGSQEIIVELDINAGAEEGESAFSVRSGEDCAESELESDDCGSPASTWTFFICNNGRALLGEDAFGTGQPWEWRVNDPTHIFVSPMDANATSVMVTTSGTPSSCVLEISASHPCGGDAETDSTCLPISDASCDWIAPPTCDDAGSGGCSGPSSPIACTDGSSDVLIECECPTVKRITSFVSARNCARQTACSDCGPGGTPLTCAERNAIDFPGTICAGTTCPTAYSACSGKFSAFLQCQLSGVRGSDCQGGNFSCKYLCQDIKVETWGKI